MCEIMTAIELDDIAIIKAVSALIDLNPDASATTKSETAIRAYLAAIGAGGQAVAVKPLEWEERTGAHYADTAFGEACVDVDGNGFYVIESGRKHSGFASVEAAQAFVQKHHDIWVKDWLEPSALAASPVPDAMQARLAMARGHLSNVEAHGNAEANAVLVIRNVLAELEAALAASHMQVGDGQPAQFLPQEDGEFNGNLHMPNDTDDGLAQAIAFVRKRRDDYVAEHGVYDPETGATELPGNGDETVGEWEEIIEGLEKLRAAARAGEDRR